VKVSDLLGNRVHRTLLQKVMNKSLEELFLEPQVQLSAEQEAQFQTMLARYASGTPIAYLLGEQAFYGRSFLVNEDVLIPRPETEGLVERALKITADRVLELCTGSGVLAVTLAIEGREVSAVDISSRALEVARQNAKKHGVHVHFMEGDLFSKVQGKYDLIIANPPYIDSKELGKLDVFSQEPTVALDGGERGMEIIARILEEAPKFLTEDGTLLLEIGWDQAKEIKEKASRYECVTIERDLFGRDRYVIARYGRKNAG
jgi:release factor glutamine methyltransferase